MVWRIVMAWLVTVPVMIAIAAGLFTIRFRFARDSPLEEAGFELVWGFRFK
jgi:hypothetical protein